MDINTSELDHITDKLAGALMDIGKRLGELIRYGRQV